MLNVVEKEIGGVTYKIKQLGSVEGRKMYVTLMTLAGPALIGILQPLVEQQSKSGKKASVSDLLGMDVSALIPALQYVLANLRSEEIERIFSTFEANAKFVYINPEQGNKVDFDLTSDPTHWSGKWNEMWKFLAACIEVNNFFPFVSGLQSLINQGLVTAKV